MLGADALTRAAAASVSCTPTRGVLGALAKPNKFITTPPGGTAPTGVGELHLRECATQHGDAAHTMEAAKPKKPAR